jgi:hypothetical protein
MPPVFGCFVASVVVNDLLNEKPVAQNTLKA